MDVVAADELTHSWTLAVSIAQSWQVLKLL